MLPKLQRGFERLESQRRSIVKILRGCSKSQLKWQPSQDRWSLLMVANHVVSGEKGILHSADELRDNPVRRMLQPGKMFDVVIEILETDVPVEVPHPSLEPVNRGELEVLLLEWKKSREGLRKALEAVDDQTVHEVMFSHPAAGPLDPIRTLRLANAHLGTHRRQMEKLRAEMVAAE